MSGRNRTGAVAIAMALSLALVGCAANAAGTGGNGTPVYRTDTENGRVVNIALTAEEAVQTIAPGVKYHVWTFDGTAPGPVIRVQLGDTIHFSLTNASTIGMQHSIDFHAAMTPWADLPADGSTLTGNYQPVNPGETKTFDWVAMYPGVFMYHCGVPPVLQHIANGMYGAIIVEPDNLPAEREYVLVSSEFYPGTKPIDGVYEGDYDRMTAVDPSYVVFNGVADQYKTTPLVVRPNEPFRLWVVNAGSDAHQRVPRDRHDVQRDADRGTRRTPRTASRRYNIAPGGGAMFELKIPDPGLYPFVTHAFAYTGLGAVGLIQIDPNAPDAPDSYPLMGDPFSAGVKPIAGAAATTNGESSGASSSGSMSGMPGMSTAPSSATSTSAAAACEPSGTLLTLVAHNVAFDTNCLAASAGKAFTIAFDNQDPGVPHNVSIYTDDSASTGAVHRRAGHRTEEGHVQGRRAPGGDVLLPLRRAPDADDRHIRREVTVR